MLYYAFMCEPAWQKLYLSSFCVLGVIGVVISFVPLFSTPQYTAVRTGTSLSKRCWGGDGDEMLTR
jgi:hypothetical protein